MKRAYSLITVKSVDQGQKRVFRGWATTPELDRVNDTINPMGAKFKNPLVLLHQHNHELPIGTVKFSKPTAKGIEFEAEIPTITEPGPLKDRTDTAWQEIVNGLVRAVSIGFRAMKYAYKDDGGIDFQEIEIFELSTVSVPANASAMITAIKSIDRDARRAAGISENEIETETRAASGTRGRGAEPPGAAGTLKSNTKAVRLGGLSDSGPKEARKMKTVSQRIAEFQEAKKQKSLRMTQIMEAAGDETLDTADAEEYDTLSSEVKAINAQISRLEDLEALQIGKAQPVSGQPVRATENVQVKSQPKLEPGVGFARLVKAKAVAYKNREPDYVAAERMYGAENQTAAILKAAVAAGTSASSNWAGDLVGTQGDVYADFAAFLRPQTILGKFGAGNVPALTRVPFRTPLILGTGGGEGYWTGEGKPKPVTAFDFDRSTLEPLKVANICVLSMENVRDSSPSSDIIVRDELVKALAARLDKDFINPAKTAAAGVSPASITNGVTPVVSAGTDADHVRTDVSKLLKAYIQANNPPETGVLIMTSLMAMTIGLMRNSLGQREFPDIDMRGGTLEGIPVITSQHVPAVTAGTYLVMVNAADIYYGDEGGYSVDVSTEASIEMKDGSLTQDATDGTGSSLVSLWQTNSIGILAERTINWKKKRASAVAVISQVAYAV